MPLNLSLNFSLLLLLSVGLIGSARAYYVLARYDEASLRGWADNIRSAYEQNEEAAAATAAANVMSRERRRVQEKRSAAGVKPLASHEDVCEMKIRANYQPKFGHEQNGTRVEIQQDSHREFRATFVECQESRSPCNGIDDGFTSECVTIYGMMPAGIRPEGSDQPFSEGLIKIPVSCSCRLRRKLGLLVEE
ncbi:NGF domain-containing protein [Aphelenchoides fujianensis]|nr:NGF domain-containing protein [Aphelenchoides fujianensis]